MAGLAPVLRRTGFKSSIEAQAALVPQGHVISVRTDSHTQHLYPFCSWTDGLGVQLSSAGHQCLLLKLSDLSGHSSAGQDGDRASGQAPGWCLAHCEGHCYCYVTVTESPVCDWGAGLWRGHTSQQAWKARCWQENRRCSGGDEARVGRCARGVFSMSGRGRGSLMLWEQRRECCCPPPPPAP